MDLEKIGKFIAELRKEEKLSQQQLADQLFVTREAVSKWERGKNLPESTCLLELSKKFNVSINEILYGERRNTENDKKIDNVTIDIYNERNKSIKYLKLVTSALFIMVFIFLGYYFINNYKTIKVYTINFTNSNIDINNGIFVVTKDKIYFNLGEINSKEDILSLKLYEKNKNEENLIVFTEDNVISIYDYYGYDEYFNSNNIDNIINNLYLDINYLNSTETIKLELIRDFVNNKFITISNNPISKIDNNVNNECEVYNKDIIKEKLEFEGENVYKYTNEKEKIYITYFENGNTLLLDVVNEEISKTWTYDVIHDYVVYKEYKNDIETFSLEYSGCNSKTILSNDNKKIINYFYETINNIYKN